MTDAVSEEARMVLDAADRILREQCSKALVDAAESGTWPADLWTTLEEAGLTRASVPERLGGAGLPLAEGLALLRLAGSHAVPVPLAETLIAGTLLAGTDCGQLPEGPMAVAVAAPGDELTRTPEGRIRGRIARVPFAPVAGTIVLVVPAAQGSTLVLLEPDAVEAIPGSSIAGEPTAALSLDLEVDAFTRFDSPLSPETVLARMALSRAVMMSGAMQSILDLGCTYATERVQFGRPIAKFQAIQQSLAELAGEAAASIRAADRALEALEGPDELIEIAVAKARAGEAAGRGAEIAHQVHGAMGFTYEHALHQRTRRLWSWRDEFGHEAHWQAELGRRISAAGADGLWAFLTRAA
jgi:alkylation response protein AidB-like acyl-CoA dehydrogenase